MKNKIEVTIGSIEDLIAGPVFKTEEHDGILERIEGYVESEKKTGYTDFFIEVSTYPESSCFVLKCNRLETDYEYNSRLNAEAKALKQKQKENEKQERRERALLKQLKKKYEDEQ